MATSIAAFVAGHLPRWISLGITSPRLDDRIIPFDIQGPRGNGHDR